MHTQEEIENSKIELAESLKKLQKNKDFKKIILEGYLEAGANNLMRNITKVKDEYKPAIVEEITARSIFAKFMDSIEEEAASIIEARNM